MEINEKYSDRDRAEMWRDYFETTALELKELKENYNYLISEYHEAREQNKRLRRSLKELVDAGIKFISSTHSIDWNDGSRETQFKEVFEEVLETGKRTLNGTNCDV